MYSGREAVRAVFEKTDIHSRLARWLDIIAEDVFEICYVGGKQNLLSDYPSRSVGVVANEQDEEDKLLK